MGYINMPDNDKTLSDQNNLLYSSLGLNLCMTSGVYEENMSPKPLKYDTIPQSRLQ